MRLAMTGAKQHGARTTTHGDVSIFDTAAVRTDVGTFSMADTCTLGHKHTLHSAARACTHCAARAHLAIDHAHHTMCERLQHNVVRDHDQRHTISSCGRQQPSSAQPHQHHTQPRLF
jgi:hypothetical protein